MDDKTQTGYASHFAFEASAEREGTCLDRDHRSMQNPSPRARPVRRLPCHVRAFAVGVLVALFRSVSLAQSGDAHGDGATYSRLGALNPHLTERAGLGWAIKLHSLMRGPYDFFRGTADLFAADVRELDPDWCDESLPPVQLHGDVHLGNVGAYQGEGTAGKAIHFGLVDFDEAIVGPCELDLLRGAVSLRCAVAQERLSIPECTVNAAIHAMCRSYAAALGTPPSDEELEDRFPMVKEVMRKARKATPEAYVAKYTQAGPLRFRSVRLKRGDPSDIMEPVDAQTWDQIVDAVWRYLQHGADSATRRRLRFNTLDELGAGVLDVAAWTRVGSSGSQGLQKFLVLLDRPLVDVAGSLIIQLKEEPIPAAARARLVTSASGVARAEEVAAASWVLNPHRPWLVGFTHINDRAFLVKTKDPWGKELASGDLTSPESVEQGGELIGALLGRSHRQTWARTAPSWSIERAIESIRSRVHLFVETSRCLEAAQRAAYNDVMSDRRALETRKQAANFLRTTPSSHPATTNQTP